MSDLAKRWMQVHLPIIGDLPLSQICIPRSRAGATLGDTKSDLGRSQTFYQRLKYGIRMFDTRPTLRKGEWVIGHNRKYDTRWDPIDNIVDDVNRFTDESEELVIIHITHTCNLDRSVSSTGLDEEDKADLLSRLSRFNHLYHPSKDQTIRLDSLHINDYIGDNKSCVVVVFDHGPSTNIEPDDLIPYNFCSINQLAHHQSDLHIKDDAKQDTIKGTSARIRLRLSDLVLTHRHIKPPFQSLLQKMAGNYPSTITIDNIHDVDAVTLCLAVTYHRYNLSNGVMAPVVVYGGRLITSQEVLSRITAAIDEGEDFTVSDEALGDDPWDGVRKSCAVYYHDHGLVKGRFAREDEALHFSQDIYSIIYGDVINTQQDVYNRFFETLVTSESLIITSKLLGGDPAPGFPKTCTIEYSSLTKWTNTPMRKRRSVNEGESMNFRQDIFSVYYGGYAVTDLCVIEKLFAAIQNGDQFLANKDTMGGDPMPGSRKTCSIMYVTSGGEVTSHTVSEGGWLFNGPVPVFLWPWMS